MAFIKPELTSTLTVFGTALAGLAGVNYGMNRWATKVEK
jgi:hypothetical protein